LTSAIWNKLLARAISAIRETNPERIIVVGPADYNGDQQLDNLEIPDADDNLIVTFHCKRREKDLRSC